MKKSYEIDMCNGPLWGKLLLFSVPLIDLVTESVALPAIPRAILRCALSYDAPMEKDTNSKAADSKIDSSMTAVRVFLSLTFVTMYFNMIFK